jgi:hypothetical protein
MTLVLKLQYMHKQLQKITKLSLLPSPSTCFQLAVKYLTNYRPIYKDLLFDTAPIQWNFGLADVVFVDPGGRAV